MEKKPPLFNSSSPYRAVVIGGTGAVGSALIGELLASSLCKSITAFVRKNTDMFKHEKNASKLTQHEITDFGKLDKLVGDSIDGHDIGFSTLGVGQSTTVSKEYLWQVDVVYNEEFARACKRGGVKHVSLVTAVGANIDSWTNVLKTKGEAEKAISKQGFERCSFFRPAVLLTKQNRYGLRGVIAQQWLPKVSWLLPSKYHEIHVESLARAMRINAERKAKSEIEIMEYNDFIELLKQESIVQ